ncbi:MAG: 50S ribosomal protein L18e [Nanoarchaeota archaeon]
MKIKIKKPISKSKIEKWVQKKSNPQLRNIIILLKKQKKPIFLVAAKELAKAVRKRIVVNLFKISRISKDGETIIVPGKVLALGILEKKINIAALSFSQGAKDKITKAGSKVMTLEEVMKNPPRNLRLII